MAPSALVQRRTHNLLLFQKLLNLRDGASPFTLLLDYVDQSSKPVVKEFMTRAKIAKSNIVYISFKTLKRPKLADIFIKAHGKTLAALQEEITSQISARPPAGTSLPTTKAILVIDSLHSLAARCSADLPMFLSSFLFPGVSLIATYHLDIPCSNSTNNPYAPSPLTTLTYLATSVLRISSLTHTVNAKRARDRSLPEPLFGINEDRDGVLIAQKTLISDTIGSVVEVEIRRKSGRGVRETFVLAPASSSLSGSGDKVKAGPGAQGCKLCLLDDHPQYAAPEVEAGSYEEDEEEPETTFNLGLTDKQKRDREGIVLPYFDAQKGGGDGGRILYEMGREDDWDPEEDEI